MFESLLLIRWTSFIHVFIFPWLGKNRAFSWYHVSLWMGAWIRDGGRSKPLKFGHQIYHVFCPPACNSLSFNLLMNKYTLFKKSVSYPMIPNVRGSVTDYANKKCVYAGRCLRPINRPWPVPGLKNPALCTLCWQTVKDPRLRQHLPHHWQQPEGDHESAAYTHEAEFPRPGRVLGAPPTTPTLIRQSSAGGRRSVSAILL